MPCSRVNDGVVMANNEWDIRKGSSLFQVGYSVAVEDYARLYEKCRGIRGRLLSRASDGRFVDGGTPANRVFDIWGAGDFNRTVSKALSNVLLSFAKRMEENMQPIFEGYDDFDMSVPGLYDFRDSRVDANASIYMVVEYPDVRFKYQEGVLRQILYVRIMTSLDNGYSTETFLGLLQEGFFEGAWLYSGEDVAVVYGHGTYARRMRRRFLEGVDWDGQKENPKSLTVVLPMKDILVRSNDGAVNEGACDVLRCVLGTGWVRAVLCDEGILNPQSGYSRAFLPGVLGGTIGGVQVLAYSAGMPDLEMTAYLAYLLQGGSVAAVYTEYISEHLRRLCRRGKKALGWSEERLYVLNGMAGFNLFRVVVADLRDGTNRAESCPDIKVV